MKEQIPLPFASLKENPLHSNALLAYYLYWNCYNGILNVGFCWGVVPMKCSCSFSLVVSWL